MELDKVHDFYASLFDDDDLINISCLPETPKTKSRVAQKFVTKEALLETITDEFLLKQAGVGRNICVCPNPLKEKKRLAANVKYYNALFVDIDNENLDVSKLPVKPHYIFKRGEKHYHLYWLIERLENTPKNTSMYKRAEEGLIKILKGDPGVKDASRLLRMPYTYHVKKSIEGRDHYELFEQFIEGRYPLSNIVDGVKQFEDDNPKTTKLDTKEIVKLIVDNYKRKKIAKGEGRSLQLYYAGLDCHGWGFEQDIALRIVHKVNETFDPPEDSKVIEHQVRSAYSYAKEGFGKYRDRYEEAEGKQKKKELKTFKNDQSIREALKNWIYIEKSEILINTKSGASANTQTSIGIKLGTITQSPIANLYYVTRNLLIRMVDKVDFRPDINEKIFTDRGTVYFNKYRNQGLKELSFEDSETDEAKDAVKLFLKHIKYLSTTIEENKFLLNYFAYIVQNLGSKLPYALLIISQYQGVGKSILETLFRSFYGHYVKSLENEQLNTGYTHYLDESVMIFVHELSQGNKYAIMNRFKNMITEPTIEINGKYAKPYTVKNCANFIAFSNVRDAIKIDEFDRRIFAIYNAKKPKLGGYYTKLYAAFTEKPKYLAIFTHLMNVDLTDFKSHEAPLMTAGKRILIEQSDSELDMYLDEIHEKKEGPLKHEVTSLEKIQDHCESFGPEIVKRFAGRKSIRMWLMGKDYNPYMFDRVINNKRIQNRIWSPTPLKEVKGLSEKVCNILDIDAPKTQPARLDDDSGTDDF